MSTPEMSHEELERYYEANPEAFAEALFEALAPKAPPLPDEITLIREAVQHVRASVDVVTRWHGVEGRRLVIKMVRKQLAYESKTLS